MRIRTRTATAPARIPPRRSRPNTLVVGLLTAALFLSIYCGLRRISSDGSAGSKNLDSISKGCGPCGRRGGLPKSGEGESVDRKGCGCGASSQAANTDTGGSNGVLPGRHQQHPLTEAAAAAPSRTIRTSNSRKYHTITTTQDFVQHWQARIHYYWFKKQRAECEAANGEKACDIGGFTRLLHSGEADDLMDEIPTVVVNKLAGDRSKSYPPLNRPYAFLQWLDKVSIPERYIMMAEPDHLFLRPMPNLMQGDKSAAAFFVYMKPFEYPDLVRKFLGPVSDEEVAQIPRIGSSPTFISVQDFRRVVPLWLNTTIALFDDAEAHKTWNWVLEMYGYILAIYKAGVHRGIAQSTSIMAQPPFDTQLTSFTGDAFYIMHLTYPLRYTEQGKYTENETQVFWKFDKRSYTGSVPPRRLPPPPETVTNALVRLVIKMVNEATENIPCWDDYVQNMRVTTQCTASMSRV